MKPKLSSPDRSLLVKTALDKNARNLSLQSGQITGRRVYLSFLILLFVCEIIIPLHLINSDNLDVEAASSTITTRADFDSGFFSGTESKSSEGELKLTGAGTWNARVWKTPFVTLSDGTTITSDATYTYMLAGRDTRFSRYIPTEDRWQTLRSAPHMPYSGAEMVVMGDYIYAIYGGYQKEFSRYSIIENTWTDLEDLPDLAVNGSSMSTDGTYIYALRGAATTDFWRYNPATDSWSTLTAAPATISSGADLVYDDSTGTEYLFTPRGVSTTTFYRYDIAAGTWSTMTVAPGTLGDNGNISKRGDYIYVLRGTATNTFYRYQISTNAWTTLTNTPTTARYVGLTYNEADDKFYVFQGNGTLNWWKYDPDTAAFEGPADLPVMPGTGSDLIYHNGYIYYKRGANTTTFYRYQISNGTWSLLSVFPAAIGDDTKGVRAGNSLYFLRGSNTTTFYGYDTVGAAFSTLGVTPQTTNYGSSLAYTGSGDYIYGTRGGLTTAFWRYSISGNSWDDAAVADLPAGSEVGIGSRLISDGTDVYAISGNGIPNILKYTVATNTWSVLGATPLAPYYGTDITYFDGKIYAQSGNYKNDFWEYTISSNTWRRLPEISGYYVNDIGPYNGGSVAFDSVNGVMYSSNGNSITRLLTFTPGANNYSTNGTWTSGTIDLSYVASWGTLNTTATTPGNSSVSIETRSSTDQITWSSWQAVSGGIIASPVRRYIQIKATMSATSDFTQTPTLSDITINYTGDAVVPTNPATFTGTSQAVGGVALTSGESYTYPAPYFSWTAGTDAATSVSGYYVYYGTNSSADPEALGNFQAATNYTVTTAMSTGTYYLRLKTKDASGNISSAVSGFTYVYAGVSPPNTATATSTADFSSGTLENLSAASDKLKLSNKAGFWQQERLSLAPATISDGGFFAYVESSNKLYTFRGINTTTFYEYDIASDTWTARANAPAAVRYGGGVVEGPNGYLFGFAGNNTTAFWRYDIASNTWDDAAASDPPLTIHYGGSYVYDGSRYIYALRGNQDDAFMRYDTETNQWDTLTNTDFGATARQLNNTVYVGGDLAFDDASTIYAIQGNTRSGFSSYDIASESWTVLPNLPALAYYGAQIAYDEDTDSIFYVPGWGTPFLYKYNIGEQTWTSLTDAPTGLGSTGAEGTSLKVVDGTIYVLRGGNTTTFYKYNISKASWMIPNVGLFGTAFRGVDYRAFGSGANIVKGDGDYYYLIRGLYDNTFVRYDGATGEAVHMASAPVGFFTGSSLVYDSTNNKVYAIASLSNSRLYEYDVATDVWSELTQDTLPAVPGAGSTLEYDGSQYIYWIRGGSTNAFYRFDTQADAGSRWISRANGPSTFGAGADMIYEGNYLYATRGNNALSFYRYDVNANTWSDPLAADLPTGGNFTADGFLVGGGSGFIYGCRGGNDFDCFKYTIGTDTWSTIANPPANVNAGGAGASNGVDQIVMISGTGTNTYTDGVYTYVIESADSSFEVLGTYTSQTHDLGSVYKYSNVNISYTPQSNASLAVQTRTSADNSEWDTWTDASDAKAVGGVYSYKVNSTPQRYIQVKLQMTSGDGLASGEVSDYAINYYADSDLPTNPSTLSSYSSSAQTTVITTENWYNYSAPYFSWPAAGVVGGASDTDTGSGISGYYVYFGTDEDSDPEEDGALQSAVNYTASSLVSGSTYYLMIKTVDNAGNVSAAAWEPFVYSFDNVAPENPTTVTADPSGYTATNSFSFAWSGATDASSGVSSYCYKTSLAGADTCDITDTEATGVTAAGSGANTFYVRAADEAGNLASTYSSVSYYFSSTAPGAPQDLEATPATNTMNEFAFEWSPPATYSGSQSNLRYYYSVNALPTSLNVNQVGLSVTFLAADSYATVPGANIMYVVAKDEAGNINYSNYASVSFTADTSSPGIPIDMDVADVSIKSTENWRLAVSWDTPTDEGSGVSSYDVYRSTAAGASCSSSFDDFTEVGSTSGTSFVDTNLTQTEYSYCVKACDSTNNCSAVSETVALLPDGKWEDAPTLTSGPTTVVKTKTATISWTTSRTSSSFVKYGTSSGNYGEEVGSSDQVLTRTISLSGLNPGTKYYYQVLWTDEDGNLGESEEATFTTNGAPFISEVKATNVSLYEAFIGFKIKSASSITVKYGKTTAYGNIKDLSVSTAESVQNVKLDELLEGTEYHFQIVAKDEEGNAFAGDDYSFKTLPVPKIDTIKVQQVSGYATATLRLIWTSNTPITSIVTYYPTATPNLAKDQVSLTPRRTHEIILRDLIDDAHYTIQVSGKDPAGNTAKADTQSVKTAVDIRAPEHQNLNVESTIVGVGDEAKAQIIVSWDTDEPSTTQVEYAEGTGTSYNQRTQEDTNLTTNHVVTITGLTPSKIYHLRAVSKDKQGNAGQSFDTVIVTPRVTAGALNLVVDNLSKTFGFLNGIKKK